MGGHRYNRRIRCSQRHGTDCFYTNVVFSIGNQVMDGIIEIRDTSNSGIGKVKTAPSLLHIISIDLVTSVTVQSFPAYLDPSVAFPDEGWLTE